MTRASSSFPTPLTSDDRWTPIPTARGVPTHQRPVVVGCGVNTGMAPWRLQLPSPTQMLRSKPLRLPQEAGEAGCFRSNSCSDMGRRRSPRSTSVGPSKTGLGEYASSSVGFANF